MDKSATYFMVQPVYIYAMYDTGESVRPVCHQWLLVNE